MTAAAGEGAGDREQDPKSSDNNAQLVPENVRGDPHLSPPSTHSAKAEGEVQEEPLIGNTPQTCRKGARSGLQTQEEEEEE